MVSNPSWSSYKYTLEFPLEFILSTLIRAASWSSPFLSSPKCFPRPTLCRFCLQKVSQIHPLLPTSPSWSGHLGDCSHSLFPVTLPFSLWNANLGIHTRSHQNKQTYITQFFHNFHDLQLTSHNLHVPRDLAVACPALPIPVSLSVIQPWWLGFGFSETGSIRFHFPPSFLTYCYFVFFFQFSP